MSALSHNFYIFDTFGHLFSIGESRGNKNLDKSIDMSPLEKMFNDVKDVNRDILGQFFNRQKITFLNYKLRKFCSIKEASATFIFIITFHFISQNKIAYIENFLRVFIHSPPSFNPTKEAATNE